jgi:protein FRG1
MDGIVNSGWMTIRTLEDIIGPVMLLMPEDPLPFTMTSSVERGVRLAPISSGSSVDTAEPSQIDQVFVAQKLVSGAYAFKTSDDMYLTSDKFGIVSADTPAVGPQQEWSIVMKPDGVALQSVSYQKFLKAQVADKTVRADSDSAGFCETFRINCQAEERSKRLKRQKKEAEKKVDVSEFEVQQM